MIRHLSARALGALMFSGGLLVLWISTIQPYWSAIHAVQGTRVYTGFGFKGTFFSPFVILCGLALTVGGEKVRTMIDGDHRFGKAFWAGLLTISFIAGALNTWWFQSQMESLNMRSDHAGHRIKGEAPMFSSEAEATAHFDAGQLMPRATFQTPGISQETWDAMSPEMRADIRRDFPSMLPAKERETGS